MQKFKQVLLCLTSALSITAQANVFKEADSLYTKRHEGYEMATVARAKYKELARNNLPESEKIYAVTQMCRLDIYRAAMIEGVEHSTKIAAIKECAVDLELIEDTHTPQYHYFYITSIAYLGKLTTGLERAGNALRMKRAQKKALEASKAVDGSFEGGGILRIMSAVRGNKKADPLGLYDPLEAVQYSSKTLDVPAVEVRPYPRHLSGKDYFENYYYNAQALLALGMEEENMSFVNKSKDLLSNTIEQITKMKSTNTLPLGRETETLFYMGEMSELKEKIVKCRPAAEWRRCLEEELTRED